MFDYRMNNFIFIASALGIPLLVGNFYLFSFFGGWIEGRIIKTVTPDSTFFFLYKILFIIGEPVIALVATTVTVFGGGALCEYLIKEYLPRKRNKRINKKMFNATKLDYKQYEALIKSLQLLEEVNSINHHTSPNKIFNYNRIRPLRRKLNDAIQGIHVYLSANREASFSLRSYPEVFNKISKEFYVMVPSLNQFITEYESIKKLDLDEEHLDKVAIFLEDITDCLINLKERIIPEFQEAKKYKNVMLHVDLDTSNKNVKFEKGYLTKQEQFPEFLDQYEEGDPRIRELTMKMKTSTSTDSTKSSNRRSIEDDLQNSLMQHSVLQHSILNKDESQSSSCHSNSSSSYDNSSNYDHSSSYDSGSSGGGCDF